MLFRSVDLTEHLQGNNELSIVLLPVPKLGFKFEDNPSGYRSNARESAKAAVSYGWDWHPRLVTRGIWDETSLVIRNSTRISDASVEYDLNKDLTRAKIQLTLEGVQLQGSSVKWVLKNPQGKVVFEKQEKLMSDKQSVESELPDIQLWWPHDYGTPNLYTNELTLLDSNNKILEQQTSKTGFRKVKMIMNEGAWNAEEGFPKSRAVAPASIEINNHRIFAKGTNWVHPEVFIGVITPERYREQIVLAKNANFNTLRI